MNLIRTAILTRYWWIILLAITSKVFAAHTLVPIEAHGTQEAVMEAGDCHGHQGQTNFDADSETPQPSHSSCCEDNCSMIGCGSVSATLNSSVLLGVTYSLYSPSPLSAVHPLKRSSTLYRPPILG